MDDRIEAVPGSRGPRLMGLRQNLPLTIVCALGISVSFYVWYYLSVARQTPDSNQPFLALAIGLLATSWAASFILRINRRSIVVSRMVEEHTRELREQALTLSALNQQLLKENRDRHKAEEALRESEQRYRLLAENATDVIYTHDFEFNWTYISPSVEMQRGWTAEEIMAVPMSETLTSESFELCRNALQEAVDFVRTSSNVEPGAHRILELEANCRDGRRIILENKVSFLYDDTGAPVGVLGVARDITRRKRIQAEKEDLELQFRHAQKMEAIGTLAGGVAHDFNNLLTGILGYTDLIKRDIERGSGTYHGIEVIEKAAMRAQQLTSQLLGFARKGKFQNVPVDLNESISDVASLLERTIDKNITVRMNLCDGDAAVSGDPGQIHQLLLNLAVNARDAMPDGGQLAFETRVATLDADFCRRHLGIEAGTYNVISVSDTGIGISREKQERIFEPFFTDKPEGRGTGMGLAMVYGVTRGHGGAITVYSEEGVGSTFRVYLPFAPTSTPDKRDQKIAAPIKGRGRILVVDDEEMLRDLVSEMLGQLGYDVVTVEDGEQACLWFEHNHASVDLAIIDMIMPNMGGWECVQALSEIAPTLPVLMSTGYSRNEIVDRLDANDLVGFIAKPYQMQQLSEAVAEMISGYPTASVNNG